MVRTVRHLPNELLASHQPGTDLPPEQRLQVAVVEQAYHDLLRFDPTTPPHEAVLEWIMSPARHPFSFEAVCESVGLDPDYLRRGMLSVAEQLLQPSQQDGRRARAAR